MSEKVAETPHEAHMTAASKEKALEPSTPPSEEPDHGNELERIDTTVYPSGPKLILVTLALCLSIFCVAIDNTILATAIPRITDDFKSINDIGWYGSSYLLTTCAFQLSFGKLYTFLNLKWVYLIALAWFELGSLICGAAPNSVALILGRTIAGVGSAGIFTGAILIVSVTVPLAKRPLYTGFIGGMYGIASVAGPLLGGVFTDYVTWRLCFYINLPLGLITAVFIIFFFHPDDSTASGHAEKLTFRRAVTAFDLPGLAILLPMIVCLLLALQWGGSQYPWDSWRIIFLLVLTGVLFLVFLAVEWKMGVNATVPGHLLKQRSVAASVLFSFMIGASFFALLYYVPIWFQAVQGVSATQSGIRNLPLVLSVTVFSIVSGGGVQGLGYYTPFLIASSILSAVGAGLIATFTPDTPTGQWIGYQIIYGAGIGLGLQLTLIAIQTVLPKKDIPTGTAMVIFAQTLGGAIFISVAQNVNTNKLVQGISEGVPGLEPSVVLRTGATQIRTLVSGDQLTALIFAYNKALTDTFYVGVATAAVSFFGAILVEWKSVKGKKVEMAGGA